MTDETTSVPVKSPNFWFPLFCVAAAIASTLMAIGVGAHGTLTVGMFGHSGPLAPIMLDSSGAPLNGDPVFSGLGLYSLPAIIGVLVAFVVERTTKFSAWKKVLLWLVVVVPAILGFGELIFHR